MLEQVLKQDGPSEEPWSKRSSHNLAAKSGAGKRLQAFCHTKAARASEFGSGRLPVAGDRLMSVIDPRNRLVNFRLSENELERLRQACARLGARSVSEFARNAVLHSLEEAFGGPAASRGRLAALDQRVAELEIRVEQLLRLLGAAGRSLMAHAPSLALASEVEALCAGFSSEGRAVR